MTDPAIHPNDEGHAWRQLNRTIQGLQRKTQDDVPVGAVVSYLPPMRSPVWSSDRDSAVGHFWTRRYKLNDPSGPTLAEEGDAANDASPFGSTLPSLGQVGGLASDASYSVYFPGATGTNSRLEAPLALSKQRDWTMEAIFKTAGLPQNNGYVVFNGTAASSGYGMAVAAAGGGSGDHLVYRASTVEWIDTGIVLTDDQWYDAIFSANPADNKLYWVIGTFNQTTKAFTLTSGSAAMATPVTPAGKLYIGAQDPAAGPFTGYVDEVSLWDHALLAGSSLNTATDRVHASLEPAAPRGWLKCDGTAISRIDYARLFSVIGTTQGSGDGSTTFALPTVAGGIIKA